LTTVTKRLLANHDVKLVVVVDASYTEPGVEADVASAQALGAQISFVSPRGRIQILDSDHMT
jgi:hypothetical protein